MTYKVEKVKKYVNSIFGCINNTEDKRAFIHSYGVSQCCVLLALKRGLDLELAAAIGLLHDLYSYKTGITALHSYNGAEMIRVAFKYGLSDLFTEDEQTIIKSAIYHHTDKNHVHDEYDELLKDGDILHHLSFTAKFNRVNGQRLFNALKELSLPIPYINIIPNEETTANIFIQSRAGDIAEALAKKKIVGDRSDADFMKIIRYYPEKTAFDELKNGWCAAFVYHCCLEAGLSLPIRIPHTGKKIANCRFTGVRAWYEWGMENRFCRFEKDGFIPERGDIVIYKNIIPKKDKPENNAWHDHIGIVLSCDGDGLTAAEGNAGNKNISDIIKRKRGDAIGCYIRIPEDYKYEGSKINFKTGEEKVINYIEE